MVDLKGNIKQKYMDLKNWNPDSLRGNYSFDMNMNEVPCLTDYCNVENIKQIEDARFFNQPIFYEVRTGNNNKIYVSTGNIKQSHFADIVNQTEGNVSIISGMHGNPEGDLLSEFNGISGNLLIEEDIKAWGKSNNIKIYDVNELSSDKLNSIIQTSDTTICGWCFSERSKLLLEALGHK
jgi:hypothetical protein